MKTELNYGALSKEYSQMEDASIIIIPVAYDGTSTWCKGADKGPEAIIEASANMELYDIETNSEVYKKGIFTENLLSGIFAPQDLAEAVYSDVEYHIQEGRFVVVIGGEHSVSIGAIRAHAESYSDMTVLQLDAHSDLRDKYEGSRYNHACVMARAKEWSKIVQIGIRSMDFSEKEAVDRSSIFYAKDIYDNNDWIEDAVSRLSDRVYVTIDLDVFDPSIMPSTGTPEPGGLYWYNVLEFLRAVIESRCVVGFDVTELCPNSRNKAPDLMAAKLIYKLLSYRFGD